jgi:hypothetical protein
VISLVVAGLLVVGGSASGGPSSAVVLKGDGVPSGTVAFFAPSVSACPQGWTKAGAPSGRLVVGVTEGSAVGYAIDNALGDREDRTHTHDFGGAITIKPDPLVEVAGSNMSGAAAGSYDFLGTTLAASTGLPFTQLLVCQKP